MSEEYQMDGQNYNLRSSWKNRRKKNPKRSDDGAHTKTRGIAQRYLGRGGGKEKGKKKAQIKINLQRVIEAIRLERNSPFINRFFGKIFGKKKKSCFR